jgi:peptidoglycan/LPS O-acetylase OafA/YrhL
MKYVKELDSLRAIAVIFVIISHWIPQSNIINKIPNGPIGVDIFFVLGGFLISKILFGIQSTLNDLGQEFLCATNAMNISYFLPHHIRFITAF